MRLLLASMDVVVPDRPDPGLVVTVDWLPEVQAVMESATRAIAAVVPAIDRSDADTGVPVLLEHEPYFVTSFRCRELTIEAMV